MKSRLQRFKKKSEKQRKREREEWESSLKNERTTYFALLKQGKVDAVLSLLEEGLQNNVNTFQCKRSKHDDAE